MSDAVLIGDHALICFEHAAEYHARHLYVAGICKFEINKGRIEGDYDDREFMGSGVIRL
jgi:hypothetical protein